MIRSAAIIAAASLLCCSLPACSADSNGIPREMKEILNSYGCKRYNINKIDNGRVIIGWDGERILAKYPVESLNNLEIIFLDSDFSSDIFDVIREKPSGMEYTFSGWIVSNGVCSIQIENKLFVENWKVAKND